MDKREASLALYIIEKTFLFGQSGTFMKSNIAACGILISSYIYNSDNDCLNKLQQNFKFEPEEFMKCLSFITNMLKENKYANLTAIKRKFNCSKLHQVSNTVFPDLTNLLNQSNEFFPNLANMALQNNNSAFSYGQA